MEKKVPDDAIKATKEAEARLVKLQNQIEHSRQRIKLSESEERAEMDERLDRIKNNKLEIKQLKNKLQELRIMVTRGQMGDEKLIAKAFRKHSRQWGLLKGKNGKEAVEILDGKVFDLVKKCDVLAHEIQLKNQEIENRKRDYEEMAWRKYQDFEVHHKDTDRVKQLRVLEIEAENAHNDALENEIFHTGYSEIHQDLKKDISQFTTLLLDLDDQYKYHAFDVEQLIEKEKKAIQVRNNIKEELEKAEADALHSRQEKDIIIAEASKELYPKKVQASKRKEKVTAQEVEDNSEENWKKLRESHKVQLQELHNFFETLLKATGVTNIADIEKRFVGQKTTEKRLMVTHEHIKNMLQALNNEKNELEGIFEAKRAAVLACPQGLLEEKINEVKESYNELKTQKAATEVESKRITELLAFINTGLWKQLQLLEKYMLKNEEEETISKSDTLVIASQWETMLDRIDDTLKVHDVSELWEKLQQEQFFVKVEVERYIEPIEPTGKPTLEEESSEDDDGKKRGALKKEAESYAEIKKKQKEKGKSMMF